MPCYWNITRVCKYAIAGILIAFISGCGGRIYLPTTWYIPPSTANDYTPQPSFRQEAFGGLIGAQYSDEKGTYSPWNLVEIDRRPERTRIVKTKKIIKTCKLSSGEYTITIEPQVFSRNLRGTCGTSISSAFTVTFDGIDIKERTPFEDFCRGNSPVITRVTVFGKTGEVKIKRIARYKFH